MLSIETSADLDTVSDNLEELGVRSREVVGRALYGVGQEIVTDAQEHYVPVQFGVLRDSAVVGEPEYSADMIVVQIGFGGAASAYAIAVHEHLSEYSPPSWKAAETNGDGVHFATGGPKYLELPFLDRAPRLEDDIAAALKTELGF